MLAELTTFDVTTFDVTTFQVTTGPLTEMNMRENHRRSVISLGEVIDLDDGTGTFSQYEKHGRSKKKKAGVFLADTTVFNPYWPIPD